MRKKDLTEEVVIESLQGWSAKGPLCARLIQEGFSFSHEQIDGTLTRLEEEGKILSFPRGMMSTIDYISTERLDSNEKKMYLREKKGYEQQGATI